MRLMRARMTRGTAVVMGVTSRPVRSEASHRRRAAASGSRTTARSPLCQARVSLRHLAAGPPRTGGYGRPSWAGGQRAQPGLAAECPTRRGGLLELSAEHLPTGPRLGELPASPYGTALTDSNACRVAIAHGWPAGAASLSELPPVGAA
jgi:hypothetical protein